MPRPGFRPRLENAVRRGRRGGLGRNRLLEVRLGSFLAENALDGGTAELDPRPDDRHRDGPRAELPLRPEGTINLESPVKRMILAGDLFGSADPPPFRRRTGGAFGAPPEIRGSGRN